jgi:hypothetical protein
MNNLISYNQLNGWKHLTEPSEQNDLIDDYFSCLIECDDDTQSCKRICKDILV